MLWSPSDTFFPLSISSHLQFQLNTWIWFNFGIHYSLCNPPIPKFQRYCCYRDWNKKENSLFIDTLIKGQHFDMSFTKFVQYKINKPLWSHVLIIKPVIQYSGTILAIVCHKRHSPFCYFTTLLFPVKYFFLFPNTS